MDKKEANILYELLRKSAPDKKRRTYCLKLESEFGELFVNVTYKPKYPNL